MEGLASEQRTEQQKAYAAFIEEERKFVADNREKVNEFKKALPGQAAEVLKGIAAKVIMVNADSPPEKSHWCIAQCRQILAHWDRELQILTKFEAAEKRVARYDMEHRE